MLFLCYRSDLTRERSGLAKGLTSLGLEVATLPDSLRAGASLRQILSEVGPVDAVLWVEAPEGWLPHDIECSPVPTGCLQIDTLAWLERRCLWSRLFDSVFVFHPGVEEEFRRAGNSQVCILGHAVDEDEFQGYVPHGDRRFEVAHVGTTAGPDYGRRRSLLLALDGRVRMNDWRRSYAPRDVPDLYMNSKIAVNIGRDWWPGDANLRCFEAMAAGALLVTYVPSELERLGFREGVHFVGFREDRDLLPIVLHYLEDVEARERIAFDGRKKTLREHTWKHRATTLATGLAGAELRAPARRMGRADVEAIYLDYYVAHRDWRQVATTAAALGLRSPRRLLTAAWRFTNRRLERLGSRDRGVEADFGSAPATGSRASKDTAR